MNIWTHFSVEKDENSLENTHLGTDIRQKTQNGALNINGYSQRYATVQKKRYEKSKFH